MGRSWGIVRTGAAAAAACTAVLVGLPGGAGGQPPPVEESTSSTGPPTPSSSGTSTSTSVPTTAPPVGELPADLGATEENEEFLEAEAGIRSQGPYASQPPFDPVAARSVFEADLARARARLSRAERAIATASAELESARARLGELDASLAPLEAREQDAVRAAATAHEDFTEAAVDAYIRGNDEDSTLLVSSEGATDYAVGKVLMESALEGDRRVIDAYLDQRAALTAELDRVAVELIAARDDVERRQAALDWFHVERLLATGEVEMWSAGAHVFISGYTFPVDGEVKFGDSFGAPRMVGTPYEHWHEGADVFAAHGTPLVAAEDGVLRSVRSGGVLGGNSLKLEGTSGYIHYYAHLAAFADGMADGRPVRAGEVVGYVGDTGNARGTSPHLHYEIQLADGTSVNPFPVLSVAHRWRQQLAPLGGEAAVPGGG